MPNELTKIDITKAKHDLICKIIGKMQMEQESNVSGKDGWNHGIIVGVNEMSEKLIEMMEEENEEAD